MPDCKREPLKTHPGEFLKVKKTTRKITFAVLGMLVLLASCREKDKGAAKTDVVMPDAKEPVNDVVQESQSDEKSEPDFGDWFMAQTDSAPVKSVIATSELVEAQFEGRYLYPPINILDGDFDSTWCEADKNGSGIGESITVEFAEPVSFDEIQIVNGFASKDYYEKNNRIKSITLTQTASKTELKDWDSEKSQFNVETKNHFQQKVYYLEDGIPDWQPIKFELPQTAQTITIKIDDIYKGEKYDDTCLDDIRLLYKGRVIPFTNVPELKSLQEENSKLMLKEKSGESFKKQFFDLFRGGSSIYLVGDNPKNIITITRYESDGDRIHLLGGFAKLIEFTNKEALLEELENSEEEQGRYLYKDVSEDEKVPTKKYVLVGYKLEGYRTSYELGNYRILKHENIDYVETTTAIITKISGIDTVTLNGTSYKVLSDDLVDDWRYWEGP